LISRSYTVETTTPVVSVCMWSIPYCVCAVQSCQMIVCLQPSTLAIKVPDKVEALYRPAPGLSCKHLQTPANMCTPAPACITCVAGCTADSSEGAEAGAVGTPLGVCWHQGQARSDSAGEPVMLCLEYYVCCTSVCNLLCVVPDGSECIQFKLYHMHVCTFSS
jgi:hypothetical protein